MKGSTLYTAPDGLPCAGVSGGGRLWGPNIRVSASRLSYSVRNASNGEIKLARIAGTMDAMVELFRLWHAVDGVSSGRSLRL
jgi:hypothetical protein